MDWSWSLNPLTTPEALNKREAWENAGPNDYQQPDRQVLAFIQEIRVLREWIDTHPPRYVFAPGETVHAFEQRSVTQTDDSASSAQSGCEAI